MTALGVVWLLRIDRSSDTFRLASTFASLQLEVDSCLFLTILNTVNGDVLLLLQHSVVLYPQAGSTNHADYTTSVWYIATKCCSRCAKIALIGQRMRPPLVGTVTD